MAQKIFISYAREDSTAANRLYDDLRRRGHDVWIDTHSLKAGEDWKLYIRQAIEQSSLVIVLISSRSVDKRGYFQAEIKQALKVLEEIPPGEVFLIPVRLDNITPKHEELKTLNWVDFFPNYEDGVKRLFASVEHQNAQKADRRALLTAHNARLLVHPFRKGRPKYLLRIGDFRGALETYNHLIDLDPEMYANYVGRAKALYGLGRIPEALKDLDVAEKLNPGHPVVENTRQEILHGAPLSADTLRSQQVNARNAANLGNDALVIGDLEKARQHYEQAKQLGLGAATYGICLAMIGILRRDAAQTREALNSFDHESAGPYMKVQIEAIKAFISVLEGAEVDLRTLTELRGPLSTFDLYRSPLTYLRFALSSRGLATAESEQIFDLLRYQGSIGS